MSARTKRHVRVLSYGGGRQTVAVAVLAATGRIGHVDAIVFADTGRELPHTYEYNRVMDAWLQGRGMRLLCAAPDLDSPTLSRALSERKAVIPMYGSRGGMMPRRCTERFKIRIVRKAMRRMGATTAEVLLGISTDEVQRMKDSDVQWARNAFPLIDLGLSTADCLSIIAEAGLPEPSKSACDICPHRTLEEWRKMRVQYPARYAYAVQVESEFPGLYLHAGRKPLPVLLDSHAPEEEEDGCTGGYCFV